MGNTLRVDSTNRSNIREVLNLSYDKTHNIQEEPSIWEHFSPMAMGGAVLFPLLFNSKEFKHVDLASGLGKQDLYKNKYRMIRANELEHSLSLLKLPKTTLATGKKIVDPFLQSELINLQHDISVAKNSGTLAKDALAQFNKKYFDIIDKTSTWKKSPLQKIFAKGAKLAPNSIGEFAKAFKNNKFMLLFEGLFELPEIFSAFTTPTPGKLSAGLNIEAGTKQIVKSAGRVAVGYTGFAAGTALGGKIGALIGSVIPGAGTIMGGIIGSAIGFAVGGVVSQLAKGAYNSIIPDTKTVAKETTIDNILANNNDESSKAILVAEISDAENKLEELNTIISQAQTSGDKDSEKEALASKATVENGYNAMVEIYQKKFGDQLVQKTDTEQPAETQTPSSNLTGTIPPAQQYAQANGFANPMTYQYAPQMMNAGQTDWSSLLPVNVQQNLFAAKA